MKFIKASSAASVAAALLTGSALLPAHAADGAAGQKAFQSNGCNMCHQQVKGPPYAGKSEADLGTTLQNIVNGKQTHPKKLSLSSTDIANIAAYIATANSK